MTTATGGIVLGGLCAAFKWNNVQLGVLSQVRNYAARKGTREKARKAKVKVEVKKIGFSPHNLRGKDKRKATSGYTQIDDSWKQISEDNVWPSKYYRWKVYSFEEAVQCHREMHHPTMYNRPNAPLKAIIELDMKSGKKSRIMDTFSRMALIPHGFDHGEERTVLAFCKTKELQEEAQLAGASLAGGTDLIRDVQNGNILLPDYQFIIAHPNILPELVTIRGLMKRKFPNPKSGTLGPDVGELVQKFIRGIQYKTIKVDEAQPALGIIDTAFGTLNMEMKHLEENFKALMDDINTVRPKREGPFVTKILFGSKYSGEKFKLDHELYVPSEENNEEDDDDEEDEPESVVASN